MIWCSLPISFLLLSLAGCGGNAAIPVESQARSSASAEAAATKPSQAPPVSPAKSVANEVNSPPDGGRESPLSSSVTSRPTAPLVQSVVRPPDRRPRHDDRRLAEAGIHLYESKRLKLYTDIDPEIARTLPPLIDQAYEAWEAYFGPLPPDPARSEFQLTGYIMADRPLFQKLGLEPVDLQDFINGRHRGYQFWMYDQDLDYYRRHLMIHEATHCFMTIMPRVVLPPWYLEGTAELFGMHALTDDGRLELRILPDDPNHWGRIRLIQEEIAAGRLREFDDVRHLEPDDFLSDKAYAWSWALCAFLDRHPRYRERFQTLGRRLGERPFDELFDELFAADQSDLQEEWRLFARGLCYGYDVERAAIDFAPGRPLSPGASAGCEIAADRGWQSSGVRLVAGKRYRISAAGQFAVGSVPKLWISEPQGVSIRYFDGRPLGMVLGTLRADPVNHAARESSMADVLPVGRETEWTVPFDGTFYLRVNDAWNELRDNSGSVQVRIEEVAAVAE